MIRKPLLYEGRPMMERRFARSALLNLFGIALFVMSPGRASAQVQTSPRVAFNVNPTVFAEGQQSFTALSVSCVSLFPLTLSAGDTFSFFVDPSVGTVANLVVQVHVVSASLSAADFAVNLGPSPNQVVITYNGQAKPFSYGDSVMVEVEVTANAARGAGKISFSSRFTSAVNGNLPYVTVAVVGLTSFGVTTVAHDGTLIGNGLPGTPLGLAVPLNLSGSVQGDPIFSATNTGDSGNGIVGTGGPSGGTFGGMGVRGIGGDTTDFAGGQGILADGGKSTGAGRGGAGLRGVGGRSVGGQGGTGLEALGGNSVTNGMGGEGLHVDPGIGPSGQGLAAFFAGDVAVQGNVSKSGGSFKIDHPLDPANKYLYHSFVESPDMKNVYDGIALLDSAGEATVELPEWFGALNRDFRYQLTCVGGFAPIYIAEKVNKNRFKIAGGLSGMEVSWLVTGIRKDAWAQAHRIPVEEDKPEKERGYYLHPELFGQAEEKSVEWANHPELAPLLKERKEQMKQGQARAQRQQK